MDNNASAQLLRETDRLSHGEPVERVFCAGLAWPPVGLTLLANQHRGRLLLQATCTPDSGPEALDDAFLDRVVHDLEEG